MFAIVSEMYPSDEMNYIHTKYTSVNFSIDLRDASQRFTRPCDGRLAPQTTQVWGYHRFRGPRISAIRESPARVQDQTQPPHAHLCVVKDNPAKLNPESCIVEGRFKPSTRAPRQIDGRKASTERWAFHGVIARFHRWSLFAGHARFGSLRRPQQFDENGEAVRIDVAPIMDGASIARPEDNDSVRDWPKRREGDLVLDDEAMSQGHTPLRETFAAESHTISSVSASRHRAAPPFPHYAAGDGLIVDIHPNE